MMIPVTTMPNLHAAYHHEWQHEQEEQQRQRLEQEAHDPVVLLG
jgi:hypothetical protein